MKHWEAQLYNLTEADLDTTVWRYLTFSKFIAMVSYGALWFPRLEYLLDAFEGTLPKSTAAAIMEQNQQWKPVFDAPDLHKQLDEAHEVNVRDGRSLTNANCWFIGEEESKLMWDEYVGTPEGVAVRSTVRQLRENIYIPTEVSFIGRVKYVDFSSYELSTYEGHQAHHRAFLKDKFRFEHKDELRISTMNLRTLACLDPLGTPLKREDIAGKGMNNFDQPGVHVRVNLNNLFDTVVIAPDAPSWLFKLIQHIQLNSGFEWVIERSNLKTL